MCICDHTNDNFSVNEVWRPDDNAQPKPRRPGSSDIYRPDVLETIESTIKDLDAELRALSLDIHAHPELRFEEYHAHDAYTEFMAKHGWEVTKQFHLPTAWQATFAHGSGGRTIGINSEMDALEGIGHACGHNLIGISGVAVALAIRATLEKHDIPGKIALLGTPAEESGSGKVILLEKGAYKGMDSCLMCHPAPGPVSLVSLSSCLALQAINPGYRLKEMLDRHLREDRHPAHGAEVRENMVPRTLRFIHNRTTPTFVKVRIDLYNGMDFPGTLWTLFLHEDIIAKTLAYERDLKTYRLNEIEASRADPGRPTYDEVFGGCKENLHRWHCAPTAYPVENVQAYPIHIYEPDDCPGIEPYSSNQIPPSTHCYPSRSPSSTASLG